MKSTIFVLLSIAILLPRSSSAAAIRSVDNSDYGIQSFGAPCASFSDSSGIASCFFSKFSTGDYGFLVGFDSPVSDVQVSFSNANILDTGLVVCDSSDSSNPCGATPTWDLDIAAYPAYASLFSSTVTSTSAIFDLTGTIPATNVHGNQVAFLLVCAPTDPSGPAASDCGGVDITVRSLAGTTPVPEPASLLLFCCAAPMLAARFRQRRTR
jgi:hypothetical protein